MLQIDQTYFEDLAVFTPQDNLCLAMFQNYAWKGEISLFE